MDQLPDPLHAGPINNFQVVNFPQIDGDRYYYVRQQRPNPGGLPVYVDYVVFTKTNRDGAAWKDDERIIAETHYMRSYKRRVELDILAEVGIAVGQVPIQNGQIMSMSELRAAVGNHPRLAEAWGRLPYAIVNEAHVFGPWLQIFSDMLFPEESIMAEPGVEDYAFTFYAPGGQAGGRTRRRRRTLRSRRGRRATRRRANSRRR